ncbi:DnaJ likeubfamily C member 2 [Schistosoma japonicum]|nr:DnaJ likeubfamily C member 2 [Schistosoma japonicum]
MALLVYEVHPHIALLREICGETNEEFTFNGSDDENYLKSLDPKDWKNQDHYSVLGLKKKRYLASADDIRKAYRRKILNHHPDKRRSKGESVQDEKFDYFSCITIAYEILGNPTKRLAYDSVDPVVIDDSVPTISEIKSNFFSSLGEFFYRKSRWSKKQPTPHLGNSLTGIEEVFKFYEFWEEYDTCRDYSYLDEEDKEKGEDRETRRAIERQNRIERARRRNEEVISVRNIVLLAKENDPRIIAANKAARKAKEAKRQARLDAVQKRREMEEEQIKREAEAAALARAASEERRRLEAERIRKERDLSRIEAKRERRRLKSNLVDRFNYFLVGDKTDESEAGSRQVSILADMDLLCQRLSNAQLRELNEHLDQADTSDQAHCIFSSKIESVKRELQTNNSQSQTKLKSEENPSSDIQTNSTRWTTEMIHVLVKAVNILPAGTPKRWEAIAAYVNQHANSASVSGKDALKQAKLLKQEDSNLRKTANTNAFDSFTNSVKETDAVKNVAITTHLEAEGSRPWTVVEQRALEQALKSYPSTAGYSGSDDRWQLIANVVGTRTRRECIIRCKELAEQVRAKKAALATVNKL